MHSTQGKKDGLYWPAAEGEETSPFGPFIAQAHAEGYGRKPGEPRTAGPHPYHGYILHILTKQGPDAPIGAYDYVINGHMIAGFALIAYPAVWGQSGVMTFIVNQQGQVFQKNLGEKTADLAGAIKEYNPDSTWTAVKD
jgi:hypothetical protein